MRFFFLYWIMVEGIKMFKCFVIMRIKLRELLDSWIRIVFGGILEYYFWGSVCYRVFEW